MRSHLAGLDRFPGGRPLRVPPEERVLSMAKGDELGRVGGADMIVKDAGRCVGGIGNMAVSALFSAVPVT